MPNNLSGIMINIVLFGPPGSGKGTQAIKIAEHFHLVHISTGDLFRYEIGNETPLGGLAQSFMNQGILVPDEVTIDMLKAKMDRHPEANGFIFDGFPRTIPQAEALDNLVREKGTYINSLIMLDVPEEELVSRLLKRGETSGRADDVNESIIRRRIEVYQEETDPVYHYYSDQDKAYKVKGVGTVDAIFDKITDTIEEAGRTECDC